MKDSKPLFLWFLENSTYLFFVSVFAFFGFLSPTFLSLNNLTNILIQSSSLAIAAIGMTFVLLSAGIDLSVGSIMFLSGVISGKMVVAGWPIPLAFCTILFVGLVSGYVNALFITRFRILPFIVTLATLYAGRGLGLYICQTRAVNLPDHFVQIGSSRLLTIPFPIVVLSVVLIAAHILLQYTQFGRQVYAVGNSMETAEKAGIPTRKILLAVYILCGLCASISGMVSIAQLGAIAPQFGYQREFAAIAAAVLGGTSLFGGRGNLFPGTVLGAVLIQAVENGLNIINTDPYVYPMITSGIIFLVVFIDSVRNLQIKKLQRRKIRMEVSL